MENGPIVKKGTSKLADSIAQLDVFEENGSKKGSKMAPTLIKPMENHQTRAPGSISFCMNIFGVYKKVSHVGSRRASASETGPCDFGESKAPPFAPLQAARKNKWRGK